MAAASKVRFCHHQHAHFHHILSAALQKMVRFKQISSPPMLRFAVNCLHGMLASTACMYAEMCALADGPLVALRCSQHSLAAAARRLQVRAPRAQVVHALPAVVPAPAPLDDCRAACEVGLQRSFLQDTRWFCV